MAEDLEDGNADCDRALDHNGFLNEQFDIFTHDYREMTEIPASSCCGNNDGNCCDSNNSHKTSKKEVINVSRKLKKAIAVLESYPDGHVLSDMLISLKDINERLRKHIESDNSEFTANTVDLPEFDKTDMELLLGETKTSSSALDRLKAQQEKLEKSLEILLAEAGILLLEVDHIRSGLRPT